MLPDIRGPRSEELWGLEPFSGDGSKVGVLVGFHEGFHRSRLVRYALSADALQNVAHGARGTDERVGPTRTSVNSLGFRVRLTPEPQKVHVVRRISDTGQDVGLWVGCFESHALKLHIDGVTTERPLTYDLMPEAFDRHGMRVGRADVMRIAMGGSLRS